MKHPIKTIVLIALFCMQPLQADFFSKDFFKQWAPAILVGAAAGFGGYFWGYKKGAAQEKVKAQQVLPVRSATPVSTGMNRSGMQLAAEVERAAQIQPFQQENDRLKFENSALKNRLLAQEEAAKNLQGLNGIRAREHAKRAQLSELAEIIPALYPVAAQSVKPMSKSRVVSSKKPPFRYDPKRSGPWDVGSRT